MTDAEIDALDEGRELDRLVAAAIGGDDYEAQLNGFRPSSDWNDAMWSVQKINWQRKHDGDRLEISYQWNGTWNAMINRYFDDFTVPPQMQLGISRKSGPLAICRAILKAVKK